MENDEDLAKAIQMRDAASSMVEAANKDTATRGNEPRPKDETDTDQPGPNFPKEFGQMLAETGVRIGENVDLDSTELDQLHQGEVSARREPLGAAKRKLDKTKEFGLGMLELAEQVPSRRVNQGTRTRFPTREACCGA